MMWLNGMPNGTQNHGVVKPVAKKQKQTLKFDCFQFSAEATSCPHWRTKVVAHETPHTPSTNIPRIAENMKTRGLLNAREAPKIHCRIEEPRVGGPGRIFIEAADVAASGAGGVQYTQQGRCIGSRYVHGRPIRDTDHQVTRTRVRRTDGRDNARRFHWPARVHAPDLRHILSVRPEITFPASSSKQHGRCAFP